MCSCPLNTQPRISANLHCKVSGGMCVLLSRVWFFTTPWTVARQAPLSMGILQARILEWVAMPSSRGSSWPRNQAWVSCICRKILYHLSHQGSNDRFRGSWFHFFPQLLVRPDVSQNGGVGSLKELSLHRNTKKMNKNCQNQLCQNSGKQSKIYSNQESTWSRKMCLLCFSLAVSHAPSAPRHSSRLCARRFMLLVCAPCSGGT